MFLIIAEEGVALNWVSTTCRTVSANWTLARRTRRVLGGVLRVGINGQGELEGSWGVLRVGINGRGGLEGSWRMLRVARFARSCLALTGLVVPDVAYRAEMTFGAFETLCLPLFILVVAGLTGTTEVEGTCITGSVVTCV